MTAHTKVVDIRYITNCDTDAQLDDHEDELKTVKLQDCTSEPTQTDLPHRPILVLPMRDEINPCYLSMPSRLQ